MSNWNDLVKQMAKLRRIHGEDLFRRAAELTLRNSDAEVDTMFEIRKFKVRRQEDMKAK